MADNDSQTQAPAEVDPHHRLDPGWPELPSGDHAVTELASARSGGLSPFGETMRFPLPAEDLPYVHPITVPNR